MILFIATKKCHFTTLSDTELVNLNEDIWFHQKVGRCENSQLLLSHVTTWISNKQFQANNAARIAAISCTNRIFADHRLAAQFTMLCWNLARCLRWAIQWLRWGRFGCRDWQTGESRVVEHCHERDVLVHLLSCCHLHYCISPEWPWQHISINRQ